MHLDLAKCVLFLELRLLRKENGDLLALEALALCCSPPTKEQTASLSCH